MKKDKVLNIVFYGIGGQGILTVAEVCGWAAMLAGYHVKKTEVHGMAQRGGSVESYLRFGKQVFSPLPPQGEVDYLVCLYPEEYPRLKHELKKGGVDLFPYLQVAQNAVGDKKIYLNTFILGVLSSYLPLQEEVWFQAMERILKRNLDENKEFFRQGRAMGGTL
jgi:indolepyruvate ferredoxin oxidoreductase, beta subunit